MSTNKVFLGNLPWDVGTDVLSSFLTAMDFVFKSVKVINDRETGKSRGFAFIEFDTPEDAREAIQDLDGHILGGRALRASEANEREDRPKSNGGGQASGGGGGGSPSGGQRPCHDDDRGRGGNRERRSRHDTDW